MNQNLFLLVKTVPNMKRAGLLLLIFLCSTQSLIAQEVPTSPAYLDVSISLFEQNLPEGEVALRDSGIYEEVRKAESRYMPTFLSIYLIQSDQWGAVRIVPEIDEAAELKVSATILSSNSQQLILHLTASDSTNRVWIDQEFSYSSVQGVSLLQSELSQDPFQALYSQINSQLLQVYEGLSLSQITEIKRVALLRYAKALSPETFERYLQVNDNGHYEIVSLPASDDPMMRRITEIQEHEYLFVDVMDEQYQQFFMDVKPVYDMWRDYQQEQSENLDSFTQQQRQQDNGFNRGSYYALREDYDNFRWAKMQDEYLDELSQGFINEVKPTEMALEESVVSLSGTIEQQYQQWKGILRELFLLEQGGISPQP